MPDLFYINRFLIFYMNQYEFLEITFNYYVFSYVCTLTIYDKEKYSTYKGQFNGSSDYMFHINDAIITFLALREREVKPHG